MRVVDPPATSGSGPVARMANTAAPMDGGGGACERSTGGGIM